MALAAYKILKTEAVPTTVGVQNGKVGEVLQPPFKNRSS